jgi:hypothetical protein
VVAATTAVSIFLRRKQGVFVSRMAPRSVAWRRAASTSCKYCNTGQVIHICNRLAISIKFGWNHVTATNYANVTITTIIERTLGFLIDAANMFIRRLPNGKQEGMIARQRYKRPNPNNANTPDSIGNRIFRKRVRIAVSQGMIAVVILIRSCTNNYHDARDQSTSSIQRRRIHKAKEIAIVPLRNAGSCPRTVVIKIQHTVLTHRAVLRPRRSVHVAGVAVFVA